MAESFVDQLENLVEELKNCSKYIEAQNYRHPRLSLDTEELGDIIAEFKFFTQFFNDHFT